MYCLPLIIDINSAHLESLHESVSLQNNIYISKSNAFQGKKQTNKQQSKWKHNYLLDNFFLGENFHTYFYRS